MFSFVSAKKERPSLPQSAYAYLVLDQDGGVVAGNGAMLQIIQLFSNRKVKSAVTKGKKLSDIIDTNFNNTLIGSCVHKQNSLTGKYLIGETLYQVVIDRIEEDEEVRYEAFYFPISYDYSEDTKKESVFQNLAHKMAEVKGYEDIDWIKGLSDRHANQLINCLNINEHTTKPYAYCPFRHKCGFNDIHGWDKLDRHLYYRTKLKLDGIVYLLALKGEPVSQDVSSKKIECTALDISLGGIRLQCSLSLPVESTLKLVFKEFSCCGRPRWKKEQGENWLIGVQFEELNAEQKNDIIRVINANQLRLITREAEIY